jgi:hypothetical protein
MPSSGYYPGAMRLTADHGEIRRWVEQHGGCPALVPAHGGRDRLDVAFDPADCDPLSWEDFFERFEREGLAFAYVPEPNGEGIRSAKLVSR